jgi:hypothetical protein
MQATAYMPMKDFSLAMALTYSPHQKVKALVLVNMPKTVKVLVLVKAPIFENRLVLKGYFS